MCNGCELINKIEIITISYFGNAFSPHTGWNGGDKWNLKKLIKLYIKTSTGEKKRPLRKRIL